MKKTKMYANEIAKKMDKGMTIEQAFDFFCLNMKKSEYIMTDRDVFIMKKWFLRIDMLRKVSIKNNWRKIPVIEFLKTFYKDFNSKKTSENDIDFFIIKYDGQHKIIGDKKYTFTIRLKEKTKNDFKYNYELYNIRVIETDKDKNHKIYNKKRDYLFYHKEAKRSFRPRAFLNDLNNALEVFNGIPTPLI